MYIITTISHQTTLILKNTAILIAITSVSFSQNIRRYTFMQAITITKTALQDISIAYIQWRFIIITKRTLSCSSFSKSFVSPQMSNDLNIQWRMLEKFMNIRMEMIEYDCEYMTFRIFAKNVLWKRVLFIILVLFSPRYKVYLIFHEIFSFLCSYFIHS